MRSTRLKSAGWESARATPPPCSAPARPPCRIRGIVPVVFIEGDQDDLGPAEEPDWRSDGADASGDEDLAAWPLDQSVKVFLAVTRRDDGGTEAGHDDLAAVGMPAQDQADATVADGLDEVGVVGQEEDGIAIGGVTEGGTEVLTVGPEVADAADPQPGATSLDPDARVVQIGELRLGESSRVSGSKFPVVVVAPNRESPESGSELAQLVDPRCDVR